MYNLQEQPIRIFLADDNQADCISFGKALAELNLYTRLTFVNNGEQMMQILELNEAYPPDIIFLDVNMPLSNGYECLDQIRQNKVFENIPVVMMSVSNAVETVNKAYKHGASLFVCKPNAFPKLKEMLKQILAMEWDINVRQITTSDFYMAL
jgi:CheY-like chemotaxis protein